MTKKRRKMFHIIMFVSHTLDWNVEGLSSSAVSSQRFEGL